MDQMTTDPLQRALRGTRAICFSVIALTGVGAYPVLGGCTRTPFPLLTEDDPGGDPGGEPGGGSGGGPFGGGDGLVVLDVDTVDEGRAVALQPDGKVLVAGVTNGPGGSDFLLVRFLPDGQLDVDFGQNGIVRTDFGNTDDQAHALALDGDKIVVVGDVAAQSFAAARYLANGELDTSFGPTADGLVVSRVGNGDAQAWDVAVVDAGYVVAGDAVGSVTRSFALVLYDRSGMPVASFGDTASPTPAAIPDLGPGWESAHSIAVQPSDGALVVGGQIQDSTGRMLVARFSESGTLDPTFGDNGKTILAATWWGVADDMVLYDDERILALGSSGDPTGLIVRLLADGTPDPQFGSDGIASIDVGSGVFGNAGVLHSRGTIVLAGEVENADGNTDAILIGIDDAGSLNIEGFGDQGVVRIGDPASNESFTAVVEAPDGRLFVAGTTASGGQSDLLVYAYPP